MSKGIDHEWTEFPVCPKCGDSDQDWWDGIGPKNDGDSWDSECGKRLIKKRTHFSTYSIGENMKISEENHYLKKTDGGCFE